jgi:hypothetical protein
MAADSHPDQAITCWHCGALVPVRRVKMLAGERVVLCPKCNRTNSLDRPAAGT